MAFKNIRFPTGISYGAVGGPRWSTDVVIKNSGHESRNQNWADARCEYDVAKGCKTETDRRALIAFFRVCKGKAHSFKFKDWSDFEVITGEGVLTQLSATTYQLVKRYTTDDASTYDRYITLPYDVIVKQGSTTLTGANYSLDATTGILTILGSPTPAPTSWTGSFDVPVRFDTDRLGLVAEDIDYFKSQNIPVVEVRYPET